MGGLWESRYTASMDEPPKKQGVCAKLAYGGILFTAAACMFFAARHVRVTESKKEYEDSEGMTENEKEV